MGRIWPKRRTAIGEFVRLHEGAPIDRESGAPHRIGGI